MGVTAGEVLGVKAPAAGQTVRLPIMLLDSAGAPVTGVAYDAAGVTVQLAKEGDSAFAAWATVVGNAFATGNWDEIGYGNYDVILSGDVAGEAAVLNTQGHLRLYVKFTATRGDTFLFKVNPADVARDDQWTDARAAKLDNLDTTVSSRSTYAGGAVASVAGAVGSVTSPVTVGTNNDKTGYSLAITPPTAADVADAVWDETSTGHIDAGKAGASIWTTVPGIATVLSGITSLAAWLRGLGRSSVMDGTAKTELNTGGGSYDESTDSLQAIRDTAPLGTAMRGTDGAELTGAAASAAAALETYGDSNWATATGFETSGAAAAAVATLNNVSTAQVLAQVNAALNTAIPGTPTANSINERVAALDDLLQASGAGDAAAIKTAAEKVSALVETAGGHDRFSAAALEAAPSGSGLTAQQTRDAMKLPPTAGDPAAGSIDAELDDLATAVAAIGSGTGAHAITLTVHDGDGTAIQGVPVTLQATGGVNVITTDSAGEAAFNRDAGDWVYGIEDTASYMGATGTVTVESDGTVSAPTGGILTITALALPTPSVADCYTLYGNEAALESGAPFGVAGMTVKITDIDLEGRLDETANAVYSIVGTTYSTDSSGQWSIDIPEAAWDAEAWLTIYKTWTQAGSTHHETQKAKLVAPTSPATQVAWADLSPRVVG